MARRKRSTTRSRRRHLRATGDSPQLDKAKKIVRTMTSRGAQRAATVQAAVRRAGISLRTYRSARKQLGTRALRLSSKGRKRGSGKWHVKAAGR